MRTDWMLVTGPVQEPLTLDEAKRHAVVSQDDDNIEIAAYLAAAREAAQAYLGRALFTQTWRARFECFADVLWLPMAAPLQNDAEANPSTAPIVQYYDADGTLQTLSTDIYEVDTASEPGRILRKPNQSWPSTQSDRQMSVLVTYVCGWPSVDSIPELVKHGIRLYVAQADANRDGSDDWKRAAEACWSMAGCVPYREPESCLR